MDADAVALLTTGQGRAALDLAMEQSDPGGLAAAQRLRSVFPAALAGVALTQAELRRRAVPKFGDRATGWFYTRDGLEQATRPEVAAHHAQRFRAAGVTRVVDLGCGIGSDAWSFVEAGLEVVAVEIDPVTAEIARLNLGDRARVVVGDAQQLAAELVTPGVGVFCDPARRTSSGRLWRVEDFTPPWSFVEGLLRPDRLAGVKLGPALPHSLVPDAAEAEWISHHGDTVEVGLWSGGDSRPGGRVATLLPGSRLVVPAARPELGVAPVGAFVYEPDGAVIRAGGVTTVGELVGGALLDPQIAYLTSDVLVHTPYAVAFEVVQVLPYKEKGLRRWLHEHAMGTVEIKKRGVDVDPAQLRRRLSLRGTGACTVILTRTPRGAVAIVARRVPTRS